jgi:hypothetical protein
LREKAFEYVRAVAAKKEEERKVAFALIEEQAAKKLTLRRAAELRAKAEARKKAEETAWAKEQARPSSFHPLLLDLFSSLIEKHEFRRAAEFHAKRKKAKEQYFILALFRFLLFVSFFLFFFSFFLLLSVLSLLEANRKRERKQKRQSGDESRSILGFLILILSLF